jgi:hypothetical protein
VMDERKELESSGRIGPSDVREHRSAFQECQDLCDRLENPGVPLDSDRFIDSSRKQTTVDQSRIEEVMEGLPCDGLRILHVGVGNSSLARRFASRADAIMGLTLSSNEKSLSDTLGLPGYTVLLLNKYGRGLQSLATTGYDLIVDNNLASFACCKFHFYRMLDSYVALLVTGGMILTDQRGMDWTAGDTRWRLAYRDLESLGSKFHLQAHRLTEFVYGLTKLAGAR